MPFSFIEIETRKRRNIFFLFATLVLFYYAGILLLYAAAQLEGFFSIGRHVSPLVYFPPLPTTIILFIAATTIALIHWLSSIYNMINRILYVLDARPLDLADRYHQMFQNIVDEVSIATGGKRIEPFVITSHYQNAFALSDFSGRAVIALTEGLLIKLNRRQIAKLPS